MVAIIFSPTVNIDTNLTQKYDKYHILFRLYYLFLII